MAPEHSRRPHTESSQCRRSGNSIVNATTSNTTITSNAAPRSSQIVTPARTKLLVPTILSIISSFLIPTAQALDPVKDFCRRWGHATTVIDDRLFVDGGYVNWEPIGDNPINYTNQWFLYHDLSKNSAGGLPPLVNLNKNSTIPDVIGGALWGDTVNKWVYAFGGEVNLATDAAPTGFTLYAYDAVNNVWDQFGRPDISLNSPSWGGNVAVPGHGLGFYYGGWLDNATVPGWTGLPLASDSLIIYDMDDGSFSNKTGPDNIGRAEGVMTYIPAGDNGFLVYFGGIQDPYSNGTVTAQPMDTILLYDFIAENWYTQKATGDIPDNRRRFCAGAAWADDYSSYNIYLYGGITVPPNDTTFDDVWILSIPSFQWLKWYPEPDAGVNGEHPHHSLTCNVIGGGSQMIIVGGSFPYTEECDSSPQYGAHNLMLGQQNSGKRKWDVLNTTLEGYEVPDAIISVIGGNAKGGATATTPSGGFDAADLSVLMTRVASAATRTPTRDINPSSGSAISKGAIAGIAVGAAVAVIAALVLGFLCLRRHRRNRMSQYSSGDPYSATDPLGGNQVWSPGSSQSPSSPTRHYNPPAPPQAPTTGSYDAPAELPGAGNMNVGTWEMGNSPSVGGMHSPSLPNTAVTDGKTDYVLVPVPVHRASHSSGHSHVQQSPSSAGYSSHNGLFGIGAQGGYMPVAQSGSPMVSPARPQHRRSMTPQELSTDPRDPNEEPRRDEIKHQTYYHPTQE